MKQIEKGLKLDFSYNRKNHTKIKEAIKPKTTRMSNFPNLSAEL